MSDFPFKILISDPLPGIAREILEESGQVEVIDCPESIDGCLASIDGWIIRSGSKITEEVLARAPKLKCICRAGAGVDNIDCDAAAARGVTVMNTPAANSNAAAEHAIALMFAIARQIPFSHAVMAEGGWDRNKFVGIELAGKCLLVLGRGKGGKGVARKGVALGLKVLGVDPFIDTDSVRQDGVELVSLARGLPRADFISLHTPLNDETRGLVGDEFLRQCKAGVRIINVSRGPVIDEEALFSALESGKVGGAALDVFESEPPAENSPLRGHPAIVCTPHLGASTVEAQLNVGIASAHQLLGYLRKGVVENRVNEPRSV